MLRSRSGSRPRDGNSAECVIEPPPEFHDNASEELTPTLPKTQEKKIINIEGKICCLCI